MFLQILKHTPLWVWAILASLLALGLAQTRTRQLSLKRVTLVPLVFVGLSLSGVITTFGHAPAILVEWLIGALITAALLGKFVAVQSAGWSPDTQQLTVPGSVVPLILIVGVFSLRYTVGISLALHQELTHDGTFASGCALAYGGFAGLFWARAKSLRRFARAAPPMEQSVTA